MAYDTQNVFARILRGELPCERLHEDSETLAFMDLMPQANGHCLVITKEPAETLFDLSADGAAACMRTAHLIAVAVKRAFDLQALLLTQVNGIVAGQTVPHVHFHIIPRRPGEALLMHAAVKAPAAELRATADCIRDRLTLR